MAPLLLIMSIDWLLRLSEYFNTYIFEDWGFVPYLGILIFIDTFSGIRRARRQKKFLWKNLKTALFDKLITYISILVLVHVITSFTVNDQRVTLFIWIRMGALSWLMVHESYSILKNIAAINKKHVPQWLLRKLEEFDKKGKFQIEGENTDDGKKTD